MNDPGGSNTFYDHWLCFIGVPILCIIVIGAVGAVCFLRYRKLRREDEEADNNWEIGHVSILNCEIGPFSTISHNESKEKDYWEVIRQRL